MEKTNMAPEPQYCYKYPHPAVTTDLVIFGFDGTKLKVLLVKRGLDPYKNLWALPGGFLNMDESAEDSALRELREETGLEKPYLKQLHTFSAPDRDPRERVVTIAYYALVRIQEVRGGDDAAEARWFALDEVPALALDKGRVLAFDHDKILSAAQKELRRQIHFESIGFELLPEKFTIKELQNLYEAILGAHFDRRNFYNKMRRLGILTRLDELSNPNSQREAFLFSFNHDKYKELKKTGFHLEF